MFHSHQIAPKPFATVQAYTFSWRPHTNYEERARTQRNEFKRHTIARIHCSPPTPVIAGPVNGMAGLLTSHLSIHTEQ